MGVTHTRTGDTLAADTGTKAELDRGATPSWPDGTRPPERATEESRRTLEGARLKSDFIANMSHELRTPLGTIIGFAELMFNGKTGPVSDTQREYLGDILTSSRQLLQLINDAVDLARAESGKLTFRAETVDLAKIAGEVCDIVRGLAATKGVRLQIEVPPAMPAVEVDPGKLKRVLYNYLSNALKFTDEEGCVTLRMKPGAPGTFRIEVEDTGIGILPEDMHRLFVEFQPLDARSASRYTGTGLGLALTRRIVEAQGGSVGAQSTPAHGSVFWATLPTGVLDGA
jgi:signal transduction histidine kinase